MMWSGQDSTNLSRLTNLFERAVIALEKIADIDITQNQRLYKEWKEDEDKTIEYTETSPEQEYDEELEARGPIRTKINTDVSSNFFEEDDLDTESLEELSNR